MQIVVWWKRLSYSFFWLLGAFAVFAQEPHKQQNAPTNATKSTEKNTKKKAENEINIASDTVAVSPSEALPAQNEQRKDAASIDQQRSFEQSSQLFLNAYRSYSHSRSSRTFTASQKLELEALLQQMSLERPNDFATLYGYYQLGQHDLHRGPALEKAYELRVNDAEVRKSMAIYKYLLAQNAEAKTFVQALFAKGVYSSALGLYGADMLRSCPQNAVLVVHGQEDALALLYAQLVLQERKDVQILSLEWLNSPQFQQKLKRDAWVLPLRGSVDVAYLKALCEMNPERNMHLSFTLPKEYLEPLALKLYLRGLVFAYSEMAQDMSEENVQLYKQGLRPQLDKTKAEPFMVNYLPFLLQLQKENAQRPKLDLLQLESQIVQLARLLHVQQQVEHLKY